MTWQEKAEALWGERWKSTLALTANITKRTIQRWDKGESRPHPDVLRKLDITYEVWKDESK